MLGKPFTGKISIAELLKRSPNHLTLTFEQPAQEVKKWLEQELKSREYLQLEEFQQIVRSNQAKAANQIKTNL